MAVCIECDNEFSDKRAALGYSRCLVCATLNPESPNVFFAEVSKSNPTITSLSEAICHIVAGKGYSEPKSGGFVRLASTKGESRSNMKPPIKPH